MATRPSVAKTRYSFSIDPERVGPGGHTPKLRDVRLSTGAGSLRNHDVTPPSRKPAARAPRHAGRTKYRVVLAGWIVCFRDTSSRVPASADVDASPKCRKEHNARPSHPECSGSRHHGGPALIRHVRDPGRPSGLHHPPFGDAAVERTEKLLQTSAGRPFILLPQAPARSASSPASCSASASGAT